MKSNNIVKLFNEKLNIINIGLESFSKELKSVGTNVVQLDWKPPAGGDVNLAFDIEKLISNNNQKIEKANQKVVDIILSSKPKVIDIGKALDVVPGMKANMILHSGPPITWERMCGPMKGGVIGGLIYEGLAKNQAEAEQLAMSGKIIFEPCHHHKTVGPMAGIVTASMPVWIFENETYKNNSYATLNEGLGKVLRYGAFSEEVINRLNWMRDILAPILKKALALHGPIDMKTMITQSLQMGDECHNRNRAGTSLFIREIAPYLVKLEMNKNDISDVLTFLNNNDHFFLNLSMAASKCTVDAGYNVSDSSIVITMARNGTDFGIKISGLGDEWFIAKSPKVEGLYLPGFNENDAAPDIGDSVITETMGIGGMAMASAPAIVKFVGGTPQDAVNITKKMYEITYGENDAFQIPSLNFRGTPTGIDLLKILQTGIVPAVNTGIAHKEPGIGMVGAGLVKPPMECFLKAGKAFIKKYNK